MGPMPATTRWRFPVLTPPAWPRKGAEKQLREYGQYLDLRSDVVSAVSRSTRDCRRLRAAPTCLWPTPAGCMDSVPAERDPLFDRLEILVLDESRSHARHGLHPRTSRKPGAAAGQTPETCCSHATFNPLDPQVGPRAAAPARPGQTAGHPEKRAGAAVEQVMTPCDMARKGDLISHLIRSKQLQRCWCLAHQTRSQPARRPSQSGSISAWPSTHKARGPAPAPLAGFKKARWPRSWWHRPGRPAASDIEQLPHVVNLDLPRSPKIMCTGRPTGRAGQSAHALSLVAAEEHENYCARLEKVDRAQSLAPQKCRASSPPIHSGHPSISAVVAARAQPLGEAGSFSAADQPEAPAGSMPPSQRLLPHHSLRQPALLQGTAAAGQGA